MRTPLLFLLIIFLSSIFRLTNIDLIEFKADEAINLLLALQPFVGNGFAPGGTVSSVGILNPPLLNYLLFPLLLINKSPMFISFSIALLNSVSVGLLFLIFRKYYGTRIALIAGSLLAFSPWSILYSRKIWMQDFLLVFLVPFIYSIHKLLVEKNGKYWGLYFASSAFLIQIHQASLFFIIITTLFLFFKKIKANLKYSFIGILIGIIPLIPYLLYQTQSGCPDCSAFLEARSRTTTQFSFEHFMRPLQIVGQGGFYTIFGSDFLTFSERFPLAFKLRSIFYLEYLLVPFGAFVFFKKFKDKRIFLYSALLLPALYFVLKVESFMHYYIIIMPFLFLFLALAFNHFMENKNRFVKYSSYSILLLILLASVSFEIALNSIVREKGGLAGDYGEAYFKNSEGKQSKIKEFENEKDYYEIFLHSYIPDNLMLGYLPVPKMLFDYENKEEKISELEKKWIKSPNNLKTRHEILALNTTEPISKKTIDSLWEKQEDTTQYKEIYALAQAIYLSKAYKKHYYSNTLRFSFDYPEHWKLQELENGVELLADNYFVSIFKIDDSKVDGDTSHVISINDKNYLVTVTYEGNRKTSDDEMQSFEENVRSLINSIRTEY